MEIEVSVLCPTVDQCEPKKLSLDCTGCCSSRAHDAVSCSTGGRRAWPRSAEFSGRNLPKGGTGRRCLEKQGNSDLGFTCEVVGPSLEEEKKEPASGCGAGQETDLCGVYSIST